jgi:hypothetical protein
VAGEAVTNAVKHSAATGFTVHDSGAGGSTGSSRAEWDQGLLVGRACAAPSRDWALSSCQYIP